MRFLFDESVLGNPARIFSILVNVVRKQLALCAENVIDHREIIRYF